MHNVAFTRSNWLDQLLAQLSAQLSARQLDERLYGQTVDSTGWNGHLLESTVVPTVGPTIGPTVGRTPVNVTINVLLRPRLCINQKQTIKISRRP